MRKQKNNLYDDWLLLRRRALQVFKDLDFSERQNCGRNGCIQLIETCKRLDKDIEKRPVGYYGDEEHGIINDEQTQHIKDFFLDLQKRAHEKENELLNAHNHANPK